MSGRRSSQRRNGGAEPSPPHAAQSPSSLAGYADTTDDEDEPMAVDAGTPGRRRPDPVTPQRRSRPANVVTSPDSLAGEGYDSLFDL